MVLNCAYILLYLNLKLALNYIIMIYINLYLNKNADKKGCLFIILLCNFEWMRDGVVSS